MDKRSAFDIDNRRGQVGESLVGTFLEALGDARIEVKTDYRAWETGNVYIETHQQLQSGEWVTSGINVTEAEFYCLAGPNGSGFITIETNKLKEIAIASEKRSIASANINTNPTHGRIVKLSDIIAAIYERKN